MKSRLARFFYRLFIVVSAWLVKRLWVGDVTGLTKIPRSPCIFIANHASYLDFVLLGYIFYYLEEIPTHFWAKTKVIKHPLWRLFSVLFQALEVDTKHPSKHLIEQSLRCLEKGENICIFPEGTRSRTGEMLMFKSGYLSLARAGGVPIVTVLIEHTYRAWPPHRRLPRFRKCNIRLLNVYAAAGTMDRCQQQRMNERIRQDLLAAQKPDHGDTGR